jgi:hypothetical protein
MASVVSSCGKKRRPRHRSAISQADGKAVNVRDLLDIDALQREFDALRGKHGRGGLTAQFIGSAVVLCVSHLARNVAEELTVVKAELRALKEDPPFAYLGTFELGRAYERGSFVTYGGSIWCARRATRQRPADGDDWQLAVKAGRDGRDAR